MSRHSKAAKKRTTTTTKITNHIFAALTVALNCTVRRANSQSKSLIPADSSILLSFESCNNFPFPTANLNVVLCVCTFFSYSFLIEKIDDRRDAIYDYNIDLCTRRKKYHKSIYGNGIRNSNRIRCTPSFAVNSIHLYSLAWCLFFFAAPFDSHESVIILRYY